DLGGRGRARLQPARRPLPAPGARRLLPGPDAGQVRGPDGRPPAAPGDHHHLGGERDDRHLGHHVPVPADRGDRRVSARPDPRVPLDLAERVAAMVPTSSAFDIVQVADSAGRPTEETAEVYFDLADRLQITRLRDRITALPREDRWSTMARAALRDDLYAAHASLTEDVLRASGPARSPEERLAAWASHNE